MTSPFLIILLSFSILLLIPSILSQIISSTIGSITNNTIEYRAISKDGKKLKAILNKDVVIGEISQPKQWLSGLFLYEISYKIDGNYTLLLNNSLQVEYDDVLQDKLLISFKNPEKTSNFTVVFTSFLDTNVLSEKYFFKKVGSSSPDSIVFIGDVIKYEDGGMSINSLNERYIECKYI